MKTEAEIIGEVANKYGIALTRDDPLVIQSILLQQFLADAGVELRKAATESALTEFERAMTTLRTRETMEIQKIAGKLQDENKAVVQSAGRMLDAQLRQALDAVDKRLFWTGVAAALSAVAAVASLIVALPVFLARVMH